MAGRRHLLAGVLVPVGIVFSHTLGFRASGSDTHARAHALGLLHDDFARLAGLGTATALVLLLLRRVRPRAVAIPLLAVAAGQGAVYVALELSERMGHGETLQQALAEPGIRWGMVVQLALAITGWLLVRVTRLLRHVLERRAHRPSGARPPLGVRDVFRALSSLHLATPSTRAPPATVLAPA